MSASRLGRKGTERGGRPICSSRTAASTQLNPTPPSASAAPDADPWSAARAEALVVRTAGLQVRPDLIVAGAIVEKIPGRPLKSQLVLREFEVHRGAW